MLSSLPARHLPDLPQYADDDFDAPPRRKTRGNSRWYPFVLPRLVRPGSSSAFFATAALSGCLLYLTLFYLLYVRDRAPIPQYRDPSDFIEHPSWPQPPSGGTESEDKAWLTMPPPPPSPPPEEKVGRPPANDVLRLQNYDQLEMDDLKTLVAGTRGFFARDYSVGLGWNMRYIIDAAFLQAQLLNRTLVLPSFIYARGCEYDLKACADYAPMVNKNDAIGWDQWRKLPYEQQMGWRLPIGLMLNITRLRDLHPVILVSDYLRLHGLSPDIEASTAQWQKEAYHVNTTQRLFGSSYEDPSPRPSLFVIQNSWYDPHGVARVDLLPEDMKQRGGWTTEGWDAGTGRRGQWTNQVDTDVSRHLSRYLISDNPRMTIDSARNALRGSAAKDAFDIESDEGLEAALNEHGFEVIYTYDSIRNMDLAKTVTSPIRQVVPRSSLRAFRDEYIDREEDVVLLEGETHNGRKAGALRFTTSAARNEFTRTVLHHIIPIDRVLSLAETLANRMIEQTEGRLWMGAHMRRGDFVLEGWVLMPSVKDHVNRVKLRLDSGRRQLETLDDPHTYDVPDVVVNPDLLERSPPKPDDPFYVATDERSPAGLATIRSQGAILMEDLLTTDDRRAFGWPLMLTDVRSVVEQELLAHSAYFYAHSKSSVSGGTVNMRAAKGADPRTTWIE